MEILKYKTTDRPFEKRSVVFSLITVLVCVALSATGTASEILELRDYMNKHWSNEMVTFVFNAPEDQCHPGSVRLETTNGTAVLSQLHDIELWPDSKMLRKGAISFVTDLAPLQKLDFCLRYSTTPLPPEPAAGMNVAVNTEDGYVDLTVETFGARFRLGEQVFSEPVSPNQAPEPIIALWLADGTRVGASRMYGNKKITAFKSELTDSGPVFSVVSMLYTYEDATTLSLKFRLASGDSQVQCDMEVLPVDMEEIARLRSVGGNIGDPRKPAASVPRDGWQLTIDNKLQPLFFVAQPESGELHWGERKREGGKWVFNPVDVPVAGEPPGLLIYLHPWRDWWNQRTRQDITLKTPEQGVVFKIRTLDPGVWVEPGAPGVMVSHGNLRMQQKWAPLVRDEKGNVYFQFNLASGERRFAFGSDARPLGRRLNNIKDYILEWDEDKEEYPHLYLNAEQLAKARKIPPDEAVLKRLVQIGRGMQNKPHSSDTSALGAWLLTGDPSVAEQVHLVERLRNHIGLMGNFDKMRHVFLVCGLYDAVIGSDLITPEERTNLRAGMAVLAYQLADPAVWSMERGYAAGPLNMSVAHVLNQGMIACTLRTHPLAGVWSESALAMANQWLDEKVGPNGEWPESVANYAYVSVAHLLPFALAARNAGFRNFIDDPRMKRLILYLAKQYTPPDIRHLEDGKNGKARLLPPVGRGGAGGRFGLSGLMARATAESDPDYSAELQWIWKAAGCSRNISNSGLAGWEHVVMHPELPDRKPDWDFDVFRRTGTIMRHGFGTPDEWFLYTMCDHSFGYPTESAAIAVWFALGVPVVSRFAGGYAEREELFLNRVLPARPRGDNAYRQHHFTHDGPRKLAASSGLPRQQYIRVEQTLVKPRRIDHEASAFNKMQTLPEWPEIKRKGGLPMECVRQVLFVRDVEPDGANYVVLRDTVLSEEPTMWQMWTVSEKIGTPGQVADRKSFLADAPGMNHAPTRQLPMSSRYTALGQFGVDLEFFIAAPAGTPRNTLHWSRTYNYTPIHLYSEYMDMLHLQLESNGVYFVAMFPRKPEKGDPPDFTVSDDGYIIQTTGGFGSDFVFLSADPVESSQGEARFKGTAASIRNRSEELTLALACGGSVEYLQYSLDADTPCSMLVAGNEIHIHLPPSKKSRIARIKCPDLKLFTDSEYVTTKLDGDALELTVKPSVTAVHAILKP